MLTAWTVGVAVSGGYIPEEIGRVGTTVPGSTLVAAGVGRAAGFSTCEPAGAVGSGIDGNGEACGWADTDAGRTPRQAAIVARRFIIPSRKMPSPGGGRRERIRHRGRAAVIPGREGNAGRTG
jgi:hypothetical protein